MLAVQGLLLRGHTGDQAAGVPGGFIDIGDRTAAELAALVLSREGDDLEALLRETPAPLARRIITLPR